MRRRPKIARYGAAEACQACRVAAARRRGECSWPSSFSSPPFVEQQRAALARLAPGERIYTDPAIAPLADVEALLAFKLAPGIASRFPALRFIACAGAGADDLLATPDVPADLPVVRAVDPVAGATDGASTSR